MPIQEQFTNPPCPHLSLILRADFPRLPFDIVLLWPQLLRLQASSNSWILSSLPASSSVHQPRATTMGGPSHQSIPHLVLVPLLSQGHIIPMLDMAHLLAERGIFVSFVTTPVNAARLSATIDRVAQSGLPIHFVELPFPCAEAGLPEGCENIDLVPAWHLFFDFFHALELLRDPLLSYLRSHERPPSCVITDVFMPWAFDVARELCIPRLVFHGHSCFAVLCYHNIRRHGLDQTITNEAQPFLVPDMPLPPIEVTRAQAPGFMNSVFSKLCSDMTEAETTADGVVLNSFIDLERPYIDKYEEVMGVKAWAVGPLPLCHKDVASQASRGNTAAVDEERCSSWLETKKPGSVIYVSFGSLTNTRPSQLIEIGAGLEASGHPFVWVIKKTEMNRELEQWLSEGFEKRTGERGLLIKGWAPQMAIMSHRAIGGFVTHCGWNSALEAVSAGVPMMTWPHFGDQFLNEKLIVEVLRIGVTVGIQKPITYADEKSHVLVTRDEVEKKVKGLMDQGAEGEERRARARELGEKARKAMKEGDSSYENMTLLIQSVSQRADAMKGS